ncbi:MAG TPA: tripartite tricarboxylate transporter substrate binding protein [Noviherbaspirillum sp.]|jgi:tripartite-type tricarboxylate transporter receptor subunit TctC|uniref:Bug family tripartite tricarboxylate transporter substrate binding protein n=1 Tax=Noviherbaspirillum sp. TaxID=1926288 RepID=UPI002DDD2E1D|nr:tripartite tricarboxylate transporter substrate binding protein [Noviherbaspirillum sp.]HEV2609123.1 tripartite tricarboxylate transporter substrate binding protein [Noviherbaspirillum sp.]
MRFPILIKLVAGIVFAAGSALTNAQDYPNKPLRWVVPYPPGGGSDVIARTIGGQLSKQVGQPVIIENKPGAGTIIGAESVARSAPDGYTFMSGDNGTFVFNGALYKKLPYDPQRDFVPVTLIARFPLLLVANPGAGFTNAKDWLQKMKSAPGKYNYASVGAGSPHHLAMEMIKQKTGTFMVHIPYRGAGPAVQDVLAGQVPMMILDLATAMPHIKTGKLTALAVLSGKRLSLQPDVPTLKEVGLGDDEIYAWQGVVLPEGASREVVTRLNGELTKAIAAPEVAKKLTDFGVEPLSGSPEQMADYIRTETARWHALIKQRKLGLD